MHPKQSMSHAVCSHTLRFFCVPLVAWFVGCNWFYFGWHYCKRPCFCAGSLSEVNALEKMLRSPGDIRMSYEGMPLIFSQINIIFFDVQNHSCMLFKVITCFSMCQINTVHARWIYAMHAKQTLFFSGRSAVVDGIGGRVSGHHWRWSCPHVFLLWWNTQPSERSSSAHPSAPPSHPVLPLDLWQWTSTSRRSQFLACFCRPFCNWQSAVENTQSHCTGSTEIAQRDGLAHIYHGKDGHSIPSQLCNLKVNFFTFEVPAGFLGSLGKITSRQTFNYHDLNSCCFVWMSFFAHWDRVLGRNERKCARPYGNLWAFVGWRIVSCILSF